MHTSGNHGPDRRLDVQQTHAIPPAILKHLKQTKPWVRFIAIAAFAGTGILFLIGLFLILGAGVLSSLSREALGGLPLGLVGLVYSAMACLHFFPALYLNRYADGIRKILAGDEIAGLEEALRNQKSFWRFAGLMLLFSLSLLLVVLPLLLILHFSQGRS